MGQTPSEIEGEFGPGVKSLVYTLKHVANMSEAKIHEFLNNFNIHISPATISCILTKNNDLFHQEKSDIFLAVLSSTEYQQMECTVPESMGRIAMCRSFATPIMPFISQRRARIV